MSSVIQSVIQFPPKPYYLLAVDSSDNTMMSVAKVCVPLKALIHLCTVLRGSV